MPEEIQPTVPNIPVKNKASVLASERKFRDTEVNKILAAFQKVDQNFTALLAEILNISLTPGPEGKTAYEVAVLNGFVGSPTDWLQSLIGAPGAPAILTRTSTTEREVGTGSKTFTYTNTPNLGWSEGMRLRASNSPTNWMEGVITAVSPTSVTITVDLIGGSGTLAAWNIAVAGERGSAGADGANAVMTRTSTTSLAIGTGSKTFTYANAANLGWVVGMRLRATSGANFMEGVIDSVSSTVVTLIVDLVGGSGTYGSWNIGVAGTAGDYPVLDINAGNIRWKLSQAAAGAWTTLFNLLAAVEDEVQAVTREGHPDQIKEVGLFATHVSKYIREAVSIADPFTVDFSLSRIRGSSADPVYKFLRFIRENGLQNNEAIIYHSSDQVPSVFVPFREVHQRFYTLESQMLSDQANQVIDKGYLVGGSYWRYNGTPNGLISDYTAVTDGNSRGEKPSWLFLEGDTYLTGVDNLNEITAVFKPFHKVGGTVYLDVVVCTIVAIPNGNLDASKPDLGLVLDCQMNENPILGDLEDLFLIDGSFYGPLFPIPGESPVSVYNPNNVGVISLGGGNFAYQIGNVTGSLSISNRPLIIIQGLQVVLRFQFTIVVRVRAVSGVAGSLGNNILSNQSDSQNTGGVKIFSSSTGTLRLSIGQTSLNGGVGTANEIRGSDSLTDGHISSAEFRTFIFTYDGVEGNIYRNNGVRYNGSGEGSELPNRTAESRLPIVLGLSDASTVGTVGPSALIFEYLRFYNRVISPAEILALP